MEPRMVGPGSRRPAVGKACQSWETVSSNVPWFHWSTGSRRAEDKFSPVATLGRKSRPGAAAQRVSDPWTWMMGEGILLDGNRTSDERKGSGNRQGTKNKKKKRRGGGEGVMQVSSMPALHGDLWRCEHGHWRIGLGRHGADSQSWRRRRRPSTMALSTYIVSQRRMRCFFGANRAADGPGNGAWSGKGSCANAERIFVLSGWVKSMGCGWRVP